MSVIATPHVFGSRQPNYEKRIFASHREIDNQVVLKIFKKTLFEACFMIALTGSTALFSATPIGVNFLIAYAVSAIVINLLCRSVDAYLSSGPYKGMTGGLPSLHCSLFYAATGGVLVHECGHALAAHLLFKNPLTKIVWTKPFYGATSFYIRSLSQIGKVVGLDASIFFVTLSGPLAGVLAGTAAIVAGLWLRKSYPEISAYLKMIGIAPIVHHVVYALSALTEPMDNFAHDFVALWGFGIHPVVAAVFILSLPLMVTLGYLAHEQDTSSLTDPKRCFKQVKSQRSFLKRRKALSGEKIEPGSSKGPLCSRQRSLAGHHCLKRHRI